MAISMLVRRLRIAKKVFLLALTLFVTSSTAQVIGPIPSITIDLTEFYNSAKQREVKHKLNLPSAMALGRSGSFYVFDDGNSRIVKVDKNGQFLNEFGFSGTRDSQVSPGGLGNLITLDSAENVYVADTVKSRVQIFNSNGAFLRSFRVPFLIEGLAVNNFGEIFVSVTASKTIPLIYVFSNYGKLLRSFGERIVTAQGELPKQVNRAVIAIDSYNNVLAAFRHWPVIRKYSREGKLLGETSFKVPSALVPESQVERYSLSFISGHPDTAFSLPLLVHSISANQKGRVYLLLNGHSIVKLTEQLQVAKEVHMQIPSLPSNATLVRLVVAATANEVYFLDIRSAGIYKTKGL